MQDPNSKHLLNQMPPFSGAMRPAYHHRRAHSEVNFRMPQDLDLASDPFDPPAGSFEEMGSEDDLFSAYVDIEKLPAACGAVGSGIGDSIFGNAGGVTSEEGEKSGGVGGVFRPSHRHSNSVDSSGLFFSESSIEAKKVMAPDKLAELWTVDPKRAKRILANRQSAARSKERKSRYISELERKVQTLQTEATTLSAQLMLFQRDTTGLSNENAELKLRLQAMEQQAHLRDALNEALKQEVERLRITTGEMSSTSDAFDLSTHQVPYNQSTFFPNQPQSGPKDSCSLPIQQSHKLPAGISSHPTFSAAHVQVFSESSNQYPLGRFQGLDISSRAPHLVKSEGTTF